MNRIKQGIKISQQTEDSTRGRNNLVNIKYNTLDINNNPNAELHFSACICVIFEKTQTYSQDVFKNLAKFRDFFIKNYIVIVWTTERNALFYELKKIPFSTIIEVEKKDNILYRNAYMTFISKNKHIFDMMVLIDPNITLRNPISIEILKQLKKDNVDTWDVLFANHSYKYYDIESLISSFSNIQDVNNETEKKEFIKKHQVHIPRNSGLIEVKSAYGGLAFYKINLFDNTTFYTDNTHVSLNLSLCKKTSKMFIDSDMVITTSEENAFLYI
jgi:hypothetical protein